MSESTLEALFDEFATSYLRGEHPDVDTYLARAGAGGDELGRLLDGFLQAVPAREPTEEDVVLLQARLERDPPILVLRRRRKLSRDAVVKALMETLGLDPAKEEKVGGYYHELETGLLDPGRVSTKVWGALEGFLHANVRVLAGLRPPPPAAAAPAYMRVGNRFDSWSTRVDYSRDEIETTQGPPLEEPDEIDRLFTAGP